MGKAKPTIENLLLRVSTAIDYAHLSRGAKIISLLSRSMKELYAEGEKQSVQYIAGR